MWKKCEHNRSKYRIAYLIIGQIFSIIIIALSLIETQYMYVYTFYIYMYHIHPHFTA